MLAVAGISYWNTVLGENETSNAIDASSYLLSYILYPFLEHNVPKYEVLCLAWYFL